MFVFTQRKNSYVMLPEGIKQAKGFVLLLVLVWILASVQPSANSPALAVIMPGLDRKHNYSFSLHAVRF